MIFLGLVSILMGLISIISAVLEELDFIDESRIFAALTKVVVK